MGKQALIESYDIKDFGRWVAYKRELKAMDPAELAEILGITEQQLQQIERGTVRLSLDRMQCIAKALGYSLKFRVKKEHEPLKKWERK